MKIDSYSNIIDTLDKLFEQVQENSFEEPIELAKYNVMIKLIETQLKAIEKQKLLDAENVDETKLTEFVVRITNDTVDDEVKITKSTKTSRTYIKKKPSDNSK